MLIIVAPHFSLVRGPVKVNKKSNEMCNGLVVRCDNKTCITDGMHHAVLGHYTVGSNNARKATYLLRLVVIHLLAQRFTVDD